ncbi:MAG TPA: hypothetical protein VFX65_11305 [Candidatus Limnocylindrales bacterium]|nr:hypothetical protein [Candidatus Limnocylindrales bacterium]
MKIKGRGSHSSRSTITDRDREALVTRAQRAGAQALSRGTQVLNAAAGTMRATRAGAERTTSALQALPDSTLRGFAATSIGLAAGLYVAGTQRLVVAAGLVPALLAGAAIVLRRAEPVEVNAVG